MELKRVNSTYLRLVLVIVMLGAIQTGLQAQFLMDMVDTTKDMGKNMLSLYKKFNFIGIGGYMQPQYQVIQEKGARTYSGPDFAPNSNNRFTLRRGRIRFIYARFNKDEKVSFQFVFQFDGTERGVNIRDFWGRVYENKWEVFALVSGVFARPFGYEVNLSSIDRESPERGRMSQTLMRTERDIGAMVSFEPRNAANKYKWLKVDAGVFNGQGLTGLGEYDSYKDFIARAGVKPQSLGSGVQVAAALSFLTGGFMQNTRYHYTMNENNTGFKVDSSIANIGNKAPRVYYGADMQWQFKHPKSTTTFRAEYWQGIQTAYANFSETPPVLTTEPIYTRNFNGAFIYLLHKIGKSEFAAKYDWYDPNSKVKGEEITKGNGNFHPGDIRYNTLGIGYINYVNPNVKLVLWYDFVNNEKTELDGYTGDLRDNVFTCRIQFSF